MNIDNQGGLHVPVTSVNQKCDECGKPGPNLKWTVPMGVNMTGVLCRSCLNKVVSQINQALAATAGDTTEPGQIAEDERFCDCCQVLYKEWALVEVLMKDEFGDMVPGFYVCKHCASHCEQGPCKPFEKKRCTYCGARFADEDAYQIHLGIGAPAFHTCHDASEMQAEGMTQNGAGLWQIDKSLIVHESKVNPMGRWATLKSRVANPDEWE